MDTRITTPAPTYEMVTVNAWKAPAARTDVYIVTIPVAALRTTVVAGLTSCVTVSLITLGRVTWNADTSKSPGRRGGMGMVYDDILIIHNILK